MTAGVDGAQKDPTFGTVNVEFEDGIAWVKLNRPEKRNAMSPTLNRDMIQVLNWLETDTRCKILVLSGEGGNFTAGMDLKEYFREVRGMSAIEEARIRREAGDWQWRKLRFFPKPTIAMVSGYCFGGAFSPVIACDLAISSDDATYGLSEINWGIIPGGNVTRALAEVMNSRDGMYYVMTGETFDGKRAAAMGLVNESVPLAQLRDRVIELSKVLLKKNPYVLRAAKSAFKRVRLMEWDEAEEYLAAKAAQLELQDPERSNIQGMKQFLDDKSYKPGLEPFKRESE
jgi:feruloyl-CoA hydratase/lyase